MNIQSFDALVFQINLVNAFSILDNRGKILSDILNFGNQKFLQDNDGVRIIDDKGEYQVSALSFLVKLNTVKLNALIQENKQDQIVSYVNSILEDFISKGKAICALLNVKKVNRFACRFIVNYTNPNDSDLKSIFSIDKKILEKDFRNIGRSVNMNELIFTASYDKNIVNLDIDRYINTNQFDVDEIDEKYDIILKQFRDNILNPKRMVDIIISTS